MTLPPIGDRTLDLATGDVDSDGDLDVVCGNDGQSTLFLNDGSGAFSDATATHMPALAMNTQGVALGDLDGDGDLDLVLANYRLQNRIYRNDGSGRFTDVAAGLSEAKDPTNAVALGDVDGDRNLDIVFGQYMRPNTLYLNDGSGQFRNVSATSMPNLSQGTTSVELGDVDGDSDLDAVFGSSYFVAYWGRENELYLNDGAGNFTDVTQTQMPLGLRRFITNDVVLGDVDRDGDLDLFVANGYPFPNELYLNNGAGWFSESPNSLRPNQWTQSAAFGDVDSDGDLDLVNGGPASRSTFSALYLNDGAGRFFHVSNQIPPEETLVVALSDVDGDADLDLLAGNQGVDKLYANLFRQLDTPLEVRLGQSYEQWFYARYWSAGLPVQVYPFVATAGASIPLGALGTLRLQPSAMAALPALVIPQPAIEVRKLSLPIPNEPRLLGVDLFAQALFVRGGDAHLSNLTVDEVR